MHESGSTSLTLNSMEGLPVAVSVTAHAVTSTNKRCPRCKTTKPLDDFYVTKSRKNGSSWCRVCTTKSRRLYKASTPKEDYKIVAAAVLKGLKPSVCPDCGKDTESHRMRGRVGEDKQVLWSCLTCRTGAIVRARQGKEPRKVQLRYCDWCCDPFYPRPNRNTSIFCSTKCIWTWFEARARRVLREEQEHADEVFALEHQAALEQAELTQGAAS